MADYVDDPPVSEVLEFNPSFSLELTLKLLTKLDAVNPLATRACAPDRVFPCTLFLHCPSSSSSWPSSHPRATPLALMPRVEWYAKRPPPCVPTRICSRIPAEMYQQVPPLRQASVRATLSYLLFAHFYMMCHVYCMQCTIRSGPRRQQPLTESQQTLN